MESVAAIVNGQKPLTIVTKLSILDAVQILAMPLVLICDGARGYNLNIIKYSMMHVNTQVMKTLVFSARNVCVAI